MTCILYRQIPVSALSARAREGVFSRKEWWGWWVLEGAGKEDISPFSFLPAQYSYSLIARKDIVHYTRLAAVSLYSFFSRLLGSSSMHSVPSLFSLSLSILPPPPFPAPCFYGWRPRCMVSGQSSVLSARFTSAETIRTTPKGTWWYIHGFRFFFFFRLW